MGEKEKVGLEIFMWWSSFKNGNYFYFLNRTIGGNGKVGGEGRGDDDNRG